MQHFRYESPLGPINITLDHDELRALKFEDTEAPAAPASLSAKLDAYFGGNSAALEGLRIAATGTPFQERVWAALRAIPPGTVATYGQIAKAIGRPKAARAVGSANARNPVALVVPCHRVLPATGTVGGYAGEPWRKAWLLRHEGASG